MPESLRARQVDLAAHQRLAAERDAQYRYLAALYHYGWRTSGSTRWAMR